jgi:hypothetical protein
MAKGKNLAGICGLIGTAVLGTALGLSMANGCSDSYKKINPDYAKYVESSNQSQRDKDLKEYLRNQKGYDEFARKFLNLTPENDNQRAFAVESVRRIEKEIDAIIVKEGVIGSMGTVEAGR